MASQEIKAKLITNNIVVSQLNGWWEEFKDFRLTDFLNLQTVVQYRNTSMGSTPHEGSTETDRKAFKVSSLISYALDVENFLGMQEAMLEKTTALMRNIWHRGALLIVKKFKLMRHKNNLTKLNQTLEANRSEPGNTEFSLP
jgi:hypothetical protein